MAEVFAMAVSVTALTFSIWMHYSIRQQSKKNIARLEEMEDIIRSKFTREQLQIIDEQFERVGIARKD